MYERIEELIKKAKNEANEHFSSDWDGTPRNEYDRYFHQKLIELVVSECVLQCIHGEDMDLIEEHFGGEF